MGIDSDIDIFTAIKLAIFLFIVCIGVIIAILAISAISLAISAAVADDLIWGGGTVFANYDKSFKENIIGSNLAHLLNYGLNL